MAINSVQSVSVQPKTGIVKQKFSNACKFINEQQKTNNALLTAEGREEKNGILTLGSVAAALTGVLTMIKATTTKPEKKLSAAIASVVGPLLLATSAGLFIYNIIDSRKNTKKAPEQQPQTTQEPAAVQMPSLAQASVKTTESPEIAKQFSAFDAKINNLPV